MRLVKIFFITSLIILLPNIVGAAMSSTNYYIYSDSLDYGGSLATSTSYNLQDSVGSEVGMGNSTSTSYQVKAGYQGVEFGTLTLSLNSNSVDLGQPSAGTVVTGSVVATVDTNSDSGYTLSISGVSGTALSAVSDGAVNGAGGIDEYGLAVSGSHAAYGDDRAVANGLVLSSFTGAAANVPTTLTFKAVRKADSPAQTYSQDLTLTLSAN